MRGVALTCDCTSRVMPSRQRRLCPPLRRRGNGLPHRRLSRRDIRGVLRLHSLGVRQRRSPGVARSDRARLLVTCRRPKRSGPLVRQTQNAAVAQLLWRADLETLILLNSRQPSRRHAPSILPLLIRPSSERRSSGLLSKAPGSCSPIERHSPNVRCRPDFGAIA